MFLDMASVGNMYIAPLGATVDVLSNATIVPAASGCADLPEHSLNPVACETPAQLKKLLRRLYRRPRSALS